MGPSTPWTISPKGQWYFINILEKEDRERRIRTHHPGLMPPNSAPTRKVMVTSHKEPGSSVSQTVAPHTAPESLGGASHSSSSGIGAQTDFLESQSKKVKVCLSHCPKIVIQDMMVSKWAQEFPVPAQSERKCIDITFRGQR